MDRGQDCQLSAGPWAETWAMSRHRRAAGCGGPRKPQADWSRLLAPAMERHFANTSKERWILPRCSLFPWYIFLMASFLSTVFIFENILFSRAACVYVRTEKDDEQWIRLNWSSDRCFSGFVNSSTATGSVLRNNKPSNLPRSNRKDCGNGLHCIICMIQDEYRVCLFGLNRLSFSSFTAALPPHNNKVMDWFSFGSVWSLQFQFPTVSSRTMQASSHSRTIWGSGDVKTLNCPRCEWICLRKLRDRLATCRQFSLHFTQMHACFSSPGNPTRILSNTR